MGSQDIEDVLLSYKRKIPAESININPEGVTFS